MLVSPAPRPRDVTGRPIPWRLFENIAMLLVLFGLLLMRSDIEAMSLTAASRLTTVIAVFATFAVVRGAPRGMWSPSATFFIILVLFHVGLVAAYGLGREPAPSLEESAQL